MDINSYSLSDVNFTLSNSRIDVLRIENNVKIYRRNCKTNTKKAKRKAFEK